MFKAGTYFFEVHLVFGAFLDSYPFTFNVDFLAL